MKNFEIYTKNDVRYIAFNGTFNEIVSYAKFLDSEYLYYKIVKSGDKYALSLSMNSISYNELDKLLVLSHVEDFQSLDYVGKFKVLNWFVPFRSRAYFDIETKADMLDLLKDKDHFYIKERAYMYRCLFDENGLLNIFTDLSSNMYDKISKRNDYHCWLIDYETYNDFSHYDNNWYREHIICKFSRKFNLRGYESNDLNNILFKLSYKQRMELYTHSLNGADLLVKVADIKREWKTKQNEMKLTDIHTVNPWTGKSRVMLLNLETVLSKYYGMDISLDFDKNAPKVNKQLKKYGIVPTQKELVAIGEFVKWLTDFDFTESLYLDLDDFNLPTYEQIDRWAFRGSCHHRDGVGENTASALREIGDYYYIRIYDCNKHARARAYYKHVGYDIAHAGMYSDFKDTKLNHTSYDATTLILSALWSRKVDDFRDIKGNHLPERDGIWCNMSALNDYRTVGTSEILYEDTYKDYDIEEDMVYSEIMERYLDRDEAIYCENIDDYVDDSHCVYSDWHDCYFAIDLDGVEEPIYSSKLNDYFEDKDALLEAAMD